MLIAEHGSVTTLLGAHFVRPQAPGEKSGTTWYWASKSLLIAEHGSVTTLLGAHCLDSAEYRVLDAAEYRVFDPSHPSLQPSNITTTPSAATRRSKSL